ncbi:hypothetical protein Mkiyose1665_58870 [Mycobacterium kiyosense]|uniref:Uncharacterized protein n=1 Tax=Mycobacterium kiyosense TaxID=2871094 RepID=A0AA37QAA0_9MYCO|nr:hypothetical protein [Mycobacterium kiyosense]BDE17156.1 hypothetical protein MKCMC460_60160 [Mycobacterium sp. 20KCMC460]GLB86634.1 hypothetical protein SRL2020028_58900 [Mycobacterium kiyosense]GLB92454.1 hypothetical protein SRL2020130_52710 [Mycobacterium kiyosense]GLB99260.1 hypothetical protein SRL2020226_60360 [Mycobacterium kiyosense]GLC04684.1 hypothetical protein SRL2020400_52750 [Mycobacterium kiyosense]
MTADATPAANPTTTKSAATAKGQRRRGRVGMPLADCGRGGGVKVAGGGGNVTGDEGAFLDHGDDISIVPLVSN